MAEDRALLTREGEAKIRAELERLVDKRTALLQEMAGSNDDRPELREDAAYEDARRQHTMVEDRIKELEYVLDNVELIGEDTHTPAGRIQPGDTVTVQDAAGDEARYTIVGSLETDPDAGRISNVSPVGHALLGKRKGQSVKVDIPDGKARLTVKNVE